LGRGIGALYLTGEEGEQKEFSTQVFVDAKQKFGEKKKAREAGSDIGGSVGWRFFSGGGGKSPSCVKSARTS